MPTLTRADNLLVLWDRHPIDPDTATKQQLSEFVRTVKREARALQTPTNLVAHEARRRIAEQMDKLDPDNRKRAAELWLKDPDWHLLAAARERLRGSVTPSVATLLRWYRETQ